VTLYDLLAPEALAAKAPSVELSLAVVDVETGESVEWRANELVPVASAAKVLLLATVARLSEDGRLALAELVSVIADDCVGGTGLLTALATRSACTVEDLAWLTAAVSDNTATNALLRRVGIGEVTTTAETLGLPRLRVHDRIRDTREPHHPRVFATGTARDLAALMMLTATGRMHDKAASEQLLTWMASNEDHGLLCTDIQHDPYSPDTEPLQVLNKTGRDTGVRADVGVVTAESRRLAYAAVACCPAGSEWAATRVLRAVGSAIDRALSAPAAGRSRG